MTAKEEEDLENAEAVCRRFLAWDLAADLKRIDEDEDFDVKGLLQTVLGVDADEEDKEEEPEGGMDR